MVIELEKQEMHLIEDLFAGWDETLIWSVLQGYMGNAFVTEMSAPKSAQIVVADFCFFAGEPEEELVRNIPKSHQSDIILMIPQHEGWSSCIEKVWGEKAEKTKRYAVKKEPDVFNIEKLQMYAGKLSEGCELQLIGEDIYKRVLKEEWSKDFCSSFENYEQYEKCGLGVVALKEGQIVAGASSYTAYKGGIEIEIDTKEEFRKQGLATACGARLILECLNRGLYPSWDAIDLRSVALAEKLGYHRDCEYITYCVII